MYVLSPAAARSARTSRGCSCARDHEVTLIEQRADRFAALEEEFEHVVQRGDATELFVLERAGIKRPPDLVLAVTGDDEDNLVICQLAKEQLRRAEGDRARQRPAQPGALRPARHLADDLRDLEHHGRSSSTRFPSTSSCTCSSCGNENLEIVEVQIAEGLARRGQARRAASSCPTARG